MKQGAQQQAGLRVPSPAACAWACFAGLVLGCGEDRVDPNAPTREQMARIMSRPANPPTPAPPPRFVPRSLTPSGEASPGRSPSEFVITEQVTTAPPPTPPVARDLSEEFRAAIGDITSCLDAETARSLRGSLTVNVTATVLPSGTMSRANVTASLPEPVRRCIQERALHASIGAVERAPRGISATLRFEVEASAAPPPVREYAPDYIPPGATAPGLTLPALGGAPPSGAQAPGLTLPALGGAPPPGAQAPGLVLPAQGP